MNDVASGVKAPLSFWIVAVVSLLWNCFGCTDYTMMRLHNAAWLAAGKVSPEMIAKIDAGPLWGTTGWAFGVWASLAGSLLLLARSRHAVTAFLVSLVGAVIGFAWQIPAGLADPIWLPVMIVAAVVLQWGWARRKVAEGLLR
jgi:hypothetical protein